MAGPVRALLHKINKVEQESRKVGGFPSFPELLGQQTQAGDYVWGTGGKEEHGTLSSQSLKKWVKMSMLPQGY